MDEWTLTSGVSCQGQFSINLIGTGLKVAEATKWTSQGNYVSVKVHRSEVTEPLSVLRLGKKKSDFSSPGGGGVEPSESPCCAAA